MCGYMGTIVDEVLCIAHGALPGVSDKQVYVPNTGKTPEIHGCLIVIAKIIVVLWILS